MSKNVQLREPSLELTDELAAFEKHLLKHFPFAQTQRLGTFLPLADANDFWI